MEDRKRSAEAMDGGSAKKIAVLDESVQEDFRILRTQKRGLTVSLMQSRRVNERLERKISDLEAELRDYVDYFKETGAVWSHLFSSLSSLASQAGFEDIMSMRKEFKQSGSRSSKKLLDALTSHVAPSQSLSEAKSNLSDKKSLFQAVVESVKSTLLSLPKQNASSSSDEARSQSKVETLKAQAATREDYIVDLERQLAASNNELANIRRQLMKTSAELTDSKAIMEKQEKKLLRMEYTQSQSETATASQEPHQISIEQAAPVAQKIEAPVKAELPSEPAVSAELHFQIKALEDQLAQSSEEKKKLSDQIQTLQEETFVIPEDKIRQSQVYQNLVIRYRRLASDLEDTKTKLKRKSDEASVVKQQIPSIEAELSRLVNILSEPSIQAFERRIEEAKSITIRLKEAQEKNLCEARLEALSNLKKDVFGAQHDFADIAKQSVSSVRERISKALRAEETAHKNDVERLQLSLSKENREKDRLKLHNQKLEEEVSLLKEKLRTQMQGQTGDVDMVCDPPREPVETLVFSMPQEVQALQDMITSLNAKVASLEAEVASKAEISAIYEEELNQMDSTQTQLETKVRNVLAKMNDQTESIATIISEKHKAEEAQKVIRQKLDACEKLLKAEKEKSAAMTETTTKLEERLRLFSESFNKIKSDHQQMSSSLEAIRRTHTDTLDHMTALGRKADEAEFLRKSMDELQKQVQAEEAKRLKAERNHTALKAQLEAVKKTTPASHADSNLLEELQLYKSLVQCKVCSSNVKNVMIVKCGHTFCRQCVDSTLEARNRRCPDCRNPFDRNDVRQLYS